MKTKTLKHKELLKYEWLNKKNINPDEKKVKQTYIDKLFIRIFLSSLLLLSLITLPKIKILNKLSPKLQDNFNFIQLAQMFNGLFGSFLPVNDEILVYHSQIYDVVVFENDENKVTNYTFDGVYNLMDGIVTKIIKNKNNTYNITIKGSDNVNYTYLNLESIDYRIYTYVKQEAIIGKAIYDQNIEAYRFDLIIEEDGIYYDFYQKASD